MLAPIKIKTTLPVIDVKAGTMIFKEGGRDKRMFLVLEGSVKLYAENDDGEATAAVIKKHQFFGEIEMYADQPRSTSAEVLTDAKLVVIRTPGELEKFATENSWLSGKMMETMGERLATTNVLLARKLGNVSIQSPAFEVESNKPVHGRDTTIRKIIRR